jgi:hypothetical protein
MPNCGCSGILKVLDGGVWGWEKGCFWVISGRRDEEVWVFGGVGWD